VRVRAGADHAAGEQQRAQGQVDRDDHRHRHGELAGDLTAPLGRAAPSRQQHDLDERRDERREDEEQAAEAEPGKSGRHQCPFS
jgi:hypothetical protein